MPEIAIRAVLPSDVDILSNFEHGFYSEYVWQMGLDVEPHTTQANFRRVRLPRRVFVPYPRKREMIFKELERAEACILAEFGARSVGYVKVTCEKESHGLLVSDLVVTSPMRRQGIASGLLLAVMNFAASRDFHHLVLEVQSKNDPAIQMADKLGFSFCGFRDHYFQNQELALFFSRFVR